MASSPSRIKKRDFSTVSYSKLPRLLRACQQRNKDLKLIMKYRCQNCGKQHVCLYENNPPPNPFHVSQQYRTTPELKVCFKLQCQCGKPIGEVVHSSRDAAQIGWWSLYPSMLIERNEKDWVSLVKAASSSYLVRITNILNKLQKVESTALQINEILTEIKAKNNS